MQFRVVVSNAFGSMTSNPATLTVNNNQPPTGSITKPVAGTLYSGGQTFTYSGTGTDPEDGTLAASRFTWRVDFHHDTHSHPFIAATSGSTSGSFTIATTGEMAANVWYRIHLTVQDMLGLTHSSFRDILPKKVDITLQSNAVGAQLKLDGQPVTAPYTFQGVVGLIRSIEAVPSNFVSWSDGGAKSHTISTPASNTTYTATFGSGSGTGSNLLVNPGFEAGAQGWKNMTAEGRSVVTTQAYLGTRSQQVLASSAYLHAVYQDVPVGAGNQYSARGWIKTDAIASEARLVLIWTNAAGLPEQLPPANILRRDVVGMVNGTQDWTQRRLNVTAPAGAVSVRVRLVQLIEADNSGTSWFDNISLVQIP